MFFFFKLEYNNFRVLQVYPLKELYFSSTSHMDQYQIAYAEKLIEYNKEVLNGKTKLDLLSKFMSVAAPNDQVCRHLTIISVNSLCMEDF